MSISFLFAMCLVFVFILSALIKVLQKCYTMILASESHSGALHHGKSVGVTGVLSHSVCCHGLVLHGACWDFWSKCVFAGDWRLLRASERAHWSGRKLFRCVQRKGTHTLNTHIYTCVHTHAHYAHTQHIVWNVLMAMGVSSLVLCGSAAVTREAWKRSCGEIEELRWAFCPK